MRPEVNNISYSGYKVNKIVSVYSSESFQMFSNDTNYRSVIIFFCLKIIALQIIQRLHWFIRQTLKSLPKSQFKLSNRPFWATGTKAFCISIRNIYGFLVFIKVDGGNIIEIHVKQYVQIKYKLYQYNIGSPDTKCRLNLTCTNKKTSADLKNVNRLRNTQVFTSLKYSHSFLKCSASLILSKYIIRLQHSRSLGPGGHIFRSVDSLA